MTLDAHVTGIWCGQIGGGVGKFSVLLAARTVPCVQKDQGSN